MLLLILKINNKLKVVKINLNTSNVTVNQQLLQMNAEKNTYLNTSNVTVNQQSN